MAARLNNAQRVALYAEIQKLYDKGLNSREIGAELGLSTVQAAMHMCTMGLKARPPEKSQPGSIKKPAKTAAAEPVKLMTKAEIAAASGWRPLSNRDRVALEMSVSAALAAVRRNPSDEALKLELQLRIAQRDRDDCARAGMRAAA